MRESKQRLDAQRQEYEGAIARHQVILRITGVSFSLDCPVRILGHCFQNTVLMLKLLLFQSFIDQLIEDKKSISQKCESLTVRIFENR